MSLPLFLRSVRFAHEIVGQTKTGKDIRRATKTARPVIRKGGKTVLRPLSVTSRDESTILDAIGEDDGRWVISTSAVKGQHADYTFDTANVSAEELAALLVGETIEAQV